MTDPEVTLRIVTDKAGTAATIAIAIAKEVELNSATVPATA